MSAEPRAIQAIGNVTAVSISPAGDRVALALLEGEVQLWQVEPAQKLVSTGYRAEQLQFSPDGAALAIIPQTYLADSARLVDSNNGRTLVAYGGDGIRFSPSGNRVAVWSCYLLLPFSFAPFSSKTHVFSQASRSSAVFATTGSFRFSYKVK